MQPNKTTVSSSLLLLFSLTTATSIRQHLDRRAPSLDNTNWGRSLPASHDLDVPKRAIAELKDNVEKERRQYDYTTTPYQSYDDWDVSGDDSTSYDDTIYNDPTYDADDTDYNSPTYDEPTYDGFGTGGGYDTGSTVSSSSAPVPAPSATPASDSQSSDSSGGSSTSGGSSGSTSGGNNQGGNGNAASSMTVNAFGLLASLSLALCLLK